jgi:5-hydroxyisourate hydrolase
MSGITTHILDTSRGRPADGVSVTLENFVASEWKFLGGAVTNSDGRISSFNLARPISEPGSFRLRFDVAPYFRARSVQSFYSEIIVAFEVSDPAEHYHVPLLLAACGYTTYRGS